jgi:multiple sugar transport system ATP-binding protein
VALGRAIVREPLAFLLDEPLGAMDAEFRDVMCGELRALHDRLQATTVYVTHDQLEAMAMADTIALMNHGVVEQLGTPQDIYDRPVSLFVADFIGSPPMSFLPFRGRVAPGDRTVRVDSVDIALPEVHEGSADAELVLGVRPEHIELSDDSPLRAEVVDAEYMGTTQIVTLNTVTGASMKARIPAHICVRPGESTGIKFRPGQLSLFDKASGRALRTALHDGGAHG